MNKILVATPCALLLSTLGFAAGWQQAGSNALCRDQGHNDRPSHCEVRELTFAPSGTVSLNGGPNGGIEVKGEARSDVRVFAIVGASADSIEEARALAAEVTISTGPSIVADGPESRRHASWWVSYRAAVPRKTNLTLRANNGGIDITSVSGAIEFDTTNGGVSLEDVGGDVKGRTTNGGLDITLTGTRWDGAGLDAVTTNGGVSLSVPANYNAQIESGTVNGGVDTDFPITLPPGHHGSRNRKVSMTMGAGGPTVRAITTNGGISIEKSN